MAENQPNQTNNPLPAVVYYVLVAIALAAGVVTLGNQAGWWRIDF